ncbi:hypothetical protein DERP_003489 [Dermatophagoides pteronyssinus]|uniref:Transmembrane protein n=1 Tax=Dermatophagoides pteronyssinus TaxID=6956 RepID=A0ABQ8JL65_DERPT|nr:hypothetical protein DERP_003489 [Dermatophagoides pteronyssinus]
MLIQLILASLLIYPLSHYNQLYQYNQHQNGNDHVPCNKYQPMYDYNNIILILYILNKLSLNKLYRFSFGLSTIEQYSCSRQQISTNLAGPKFQ